MGDVVAFVNLTWTIETLRVKHCDGQLRRVRDVVIRIDMFERPATSRGERVLTKTRGLP